MPSMHDPSAIHCADETFEPGTWTLCGRRHNDRTVSASEFDALDPEHRCDVCRAQRGLIAAALPT